MCDFERLLKLRLVVARHGEMDGARWWNTQGMLGPRGAMVLRRGFPATHLFAQARVVFEVARTRCREVFHPPAVMTLWELPADIEDKFADAWQEWLDHITKWQPFFAHLATLSGGDLLETLVQFDLLSNEQQGIVSRLRRSADGRAVALPGVYSVDDNTLTLLAAAFSRGTSGQLAVPYARLDGSGT
jgi:hypothetical protein